MKRKVLYTLTILIAFFSFTTIEASIKTKKHTVVLYWDASLSQANKDINKEFEFLDKYFKAYPNSIVKLIIFNTRVFFDDDFEIVSSNWKVLKQKLGNVVYNGASNFGLVNTDVSCDNLLFFTDGYGNFGDFESNLYSPPIITISSHKSINKKFLHETAYYNQGYFINLFKNSNIDDGVQSIKDKKNLPHLKFVDDSNEKKNYVEGIISDGNEILSNVNIEIKGKNITTFSTENGEYKIQVDPGDILQFSYPGKKGKSVKVGHEKTIDIQFSNIRNELETVVIKNRVNEEGEKVTIGGIVKDKKTLGYDVKTLSSDELKSDNSINLTHTLSGKVAGMTVQTGFVKNIFIRGRGNSIDPRLVNNPIFIVDGVPVRTSHGLANTPLNSLGGSAPNNNGPLGIEDVVNPLNIKKVTVLKGLAATNRYGELGLNGVILITTKTGSSQLSDAKKNKKKAVEIKYTIFDKPLEIKVNEDSGYIKVLQSFSNLDRAYEHFINQLNHNTEDAMYFIDSADYFFSKNDRERAIQILSNLIELFPNDTAILKVVAYNFEKNGSYNEAYNLYERILKLSPTVPQSFLDLANNHVSKKEYKKALKIFTKITNDEYNNVISWNGLKNQVDNDFKNLLMNRNQTWNIKKINSNYFKKAQYDIRVVIECSKVQTEYELQYINPLKQCFSIPHTNKKSKEILSQELKEGYNSNEFTQVSMENGIWYLNLVPKKIKKDRKKPTYIKVRIYTHFGKPNQKSQIHVLNLDTIKQEKIFASFEI